MKKLQQKRISISISPQLKAQIEQLAKVNYRTLNGEINKALDFYILSQGNAEVVRKESLTTPTQIVEAPSLTQTEVKLYHNASINTNNNQYDEIEEF